MVTIGPFGKYRAALSTDDNYKRIFAFPRTLDALHVASALMDPPR